MKQRTIDTFWEERGATAAEYAILASLIAVVIVAAVTSVGLGVDALFQRVAPPWN